MRQLELVAPGQDIDLIVIPRNHTGTQSYTNLSIDWREDGTGVEKNYVHGNITTVVSSQYVTFSMAIDHDFHKKGSTYKFTISDNGGLLYRGKAHFLLDQGETLDKSAKYSIQEQSDGTSEYKETSHDDQFITI